MDFFFEVLIGGLLDTVKSLTLNGNESVTGQGKLDNQNGSDSEFMFAVKRNSNGKVTGQAIIRNPSYKAGNGQNDKIKIDMTCLKVVGNVAFLGGTTKRKNNQAKTEAVYFAVEDNGEQGTDAVFRGFYFDDDPATDGDSHRCEAIERSVVVLEPSAKGDIQVKGK